MKKLMIAILLLSTFSVLADESEIHNQYRYKLNTGKVPYQPQAFPPIKPLKVSQDLKKSSQEMVNNCDWEHSRPGENLYISSGNAEVKDAVKYWYEEHVSYDAGLDSCIGGVCGHYTQIMDNRSTEVGCSTNYCPSMKNLDFSGTFVACHYNPPGNYNGNKPYLTEDVVVTSLLENDILWVSGVEVEGTYFNALLTMDYPYFYLYRYEVFENGVDYSFFSNDELYIPNTVTKYGNMEVWLKWEGTRFKLDRYNKL